MVISIFSISCNVFKRLLIFLLGRQESSLRGQPSPHSSGGSVADLRTGGRWFDPLVGQYSFRGLMVIIATGFIPPAVRCFDNGHVGKQTVAWTEYCAEYWLKKLQESMDRCTGRRDITEIILIMALNTIQPINCVVKGLYT